MTTEPVPEYDRDWRRAFFVSQIESLCRIARLRGLTKMDVAERLRVVADRIEREAG